MTLQGYYRRTLALPLLLPVLTLPLMRAEARLPEGLAVPTLLLYGSLLIGGIPYALFAVGFLLWMRGRPDHEVRGGILLSPIAYAVMLMICAVTFLAIDTPMAWNDLDVICALGAIAVVFGYAYVLIAELGRVLLRPGGISPAV